MWKFYQRVWGVEWGVVGWVTSDQENPLLVPPVVYPKWVLPNSRAAAPSCMPELDIKVKVNTYQKVLAHPILIAHTVKRVSCPDEKIKVEFASITSGYDNS